MAANSHGRPASPTDERTPLLGSKASATQDSEKPLPKDQLFLLCFARLVEPVAFFSIFPFVNFMVADLGIPEKHCGFYTGAIESLFSFVQFLIMPIWGKYSDRVGRKPILVLSLIGLAVTSTLFGLSRSVWQMILFRCLSGFFSGSTVTIRTMISEISTPKTQARSFSLFAFAGNIAILLAPLMGGALAKPADNFSFFRKVELFVSFPYLLPCIVTGSLALMAALANLFFLKETLAPVEKSESEVARGELSTKEILASDGVTRVLTIYLWTFTIAFAYTALIPVFWFTPVDFGGYGLSALHISYLMGIGGAGQAFWTLLVFPWLHGRIGSIGILKASGMGWCLMFVIYSFMNLGLRQGLSERAFWGMAIPFAIIGSAISMSFTSVQLCLNDISPSPSALGRLNGFGLSGMALSRSIAPVLITSIFAFGVSKQILWGQLAWLVLFFVAVGYNVMVRFLPKKAWGFLPDTLISRDEEENA